MIFRVLVGCGIVYQILGMIAAYRFRKRPVTRASAGPVSILKPVRGQDPGFYHAIRSHATLHYAPGYELLFGLSNPDDPARGEISRLQSEFPHLNIQVIDTRNTAANGKVGSLEILLRHAAHPLIVVNDSDIVVQPDYLERVVATLLEDGVGLVTALYRGRGYSLPAKVECLGIATEFAPSVLVADMLAASSLAFGSTIAVRRSDLEAIGGFRMIREYLADDFQLGSRIASIGKRSVLSGQVVETSLGKGSLADVWKHQLRWTRTIRVSNPTGYYGYAITQLTLWCLLAAMGGDLRVALLGTAVRLAGARTACTTLGDATARRMVLLTPLRDLFGTAIWIAGLLGNTVEWRGLRFRLHRNGTITPLS